MSKTTSKAKTETKTINFEKEAVRADENQAKLREGMLSAINGILDQKDWTQTDMARVFDVTQPRISNLRNNIASKFSIDALLKMLMVLGYNIDFGYVPATSRKGTDKIQFTVTTNK